MLKKFKRQTMKISIFLTCLMDFICTASENIPRNYFLQGPQHPSNAFRVSLQHKNRRNYFPNSNSRERSFIPNSNVTSNSYDKPNGRDMRYHNRNEPLRHSNLDEHVPRKRSPTYFSAFTHNTDQSGHVAADGSIYNHNLLKQTDIGQEYRSQPDDNAYPNVYMIDKIVPYDLLKFNFGKKLEEFNFSALDANNQPVVFFYCATYLLTLKSKHVLEPSLYTLFHVYVDLGNTVWYINEHVIFYEDSSYVYSQPIFFVDFKYNNMHVYADQSSPQQSNDDFLNTNEAADHAKRQSSVEIKRVDCNTNIEKNANKKTSEETIEEADENTNSNTDGNDIGFSETKNEVAIEHQIFSQEVLSEKQEPISEQDSDLTNKFNENITGSNQEKSLSLQKIEINDKHVAKTSLLNDNNVENRLLKPDLKENNQYVNTSKLTNSNPSIKDINEVKGELPLTNQTQNCNFQDSEDTFYNDSLKDTSKKTKEPFTDTQDYSSTVTLMTGKNSGEQNDCSMQHEFSLGSNKFDSTLESTGFIPSEDLVEFEINDEIASRMNTEHEKKNYIEALDSNQKQVEEVRIFHGKEEDTQFNLTNTLPTKKFSELFETTNPTFPNLPFKNSTHRLDSSSSKKDNKTILHGQKKEKTFGTLQNYGSIVTKPKKNKHHQQNDGWNVVNHKKTESEITTFPVFDVNSLDSEVKVENNERTVKSIDSNIRTKGELPKDDNTIKQEENPKNHDQPQDCITKGEVDQKNTCNDTKESEETITTTKTSINKKPEQIAENKINVESKKAPKKRKRKSCGEKKPDGAMSMDFFGLPETEPLHQKSKKKSEKARKNIYLNKEKISEIKVQDYKNQTSKSESAFNKQPLPINICADIEMHSNVNSLDNNSNEIIDDENLVFLTKPFKKAKKNNKRRKKKKKTAKRVVTDNDSNASNSLKQATSTHQDTENETKFIEKNFEAQEAVSGYSLNQQISDQLEIHLHINYLMKSIHIKPVPFNYKEFHTAILTRDLTLDVYRFYHLSESEIKYIYFIVAVFRLITYDSLKSYKKNIFQIENPNETTTEELAFYRNQILYKIFRNKDLVTDSRLHNMYVLENPVDQEQVKLLLFFLDIILQSCKVLIKNIIEYEIDQTATKIDALDFRILLFRGKLSFNHLELDNGYIIKAKNDIELEDGLIEVNNIMRKKSYLNRK